MPHIHIIVTFMDDSAEAFPVDHQTGWYCRVKESIPFLIIGGPPPRIEIPLGNVKFFRIQDWDSDEREEQEMANWQEELNRERMNDEPDENEVTSP